jgi:pyrroline-5-carboxylate reductase
MTGKTVFLGAGNMTEALVSGLVDGQAGDIVVTDVRPERLEYFRSKFRVAGVANNREAVREAGVVVLAVKPQVMSEVLADLKGAIPADAVVVSIAAGITTSRIEAELGGSPKVVRVMPNTPALVKRGAAGICAGRYALDADVAKAETIFRAVGVAVRVTEADIDAVTAVSGSGPAYLFYVMEAMLEAAGRMGLDAGTARLLVEQTFAGAVEMVARTGDEPEELRRRVTSKGGTTEAALKVFECKGIKSSIIEAMLAAQNRSRELSGQ